MMRLDRKPRETSRTVGPLREEEVSRPSSTPVEEHAAFVASAQRVFGNRAVGAALRGESVDGPEAVLHAALAFGAAGISVGSDVRDVLSNSAIIRLLASAAPSVDGAPAPAPAPAPGASGFGGFGGFGLDFGASGLASAGLGSVGLAASGFEGLGASGFDGGGASGFEGSAGVDRALARHPGRAGGGGRAPQLVERAARSGARPLPDTVRAEMEARFGERFADVVVHTDGAAQAAAEAVQARAYTVGNEIWFGRGEFRPGDPAGLELLAHELTHVLQNRGGDARSDGGETVDGMAVSSPGDARELEAVATARDVMRGPAPSLDGGLSPTMDLHADLGSSDSGMSVATGGGDMLSRIHDPEKPRKKTLKDGTVITIYSDGNGGYYLQSPEGDKLKCDKDGTPDEDALNKHSKKAEQKGNNSPKPDEPEKTIPPETSPNTEKTKGDVKKPKGGGSEKVENPGGDGTGGTSTGESGMGTYPQLSGDKLSKYETEKTWHDTWKATGGQTGSLNTVDGMDKTGLIGDALLSGGAEGFVNGAQAMLIDTVLNKATKNIPYAAGFIAIAQIAYDPKKWWEDTVVKGIGGKVGEGFDKLTSDKSDWIDRFEGVISILEGLNNIIGLASTVCMIVAAAGFILSFICPALIPFVALAAKWGLLLGEINTIVGLGINILRMIVVVCRAVQIAVSDADPATQAERAAKLKAMTAAWSEDFTKRQGAKLQQKVAKKAKKNDPPDPAAPAAPVASGGGNAATTQKTGWRSRAAKIASEVTGVGAIKEQVKTTFGDKSTGSTGTIGQLKDMRAAYKNENLSAKGRFEAMNKADPNAFTQNTKERYGRHLDKKAANTKAKGETTASTKNAQLLENIKKNREAMAANNEGKGLAKDKGTAFGDRDMSAAGIRKKATDPDFWENASKAERKAVRRHLEKSPNPEDRKLAAHMKLAERRLAEFEQGKKLVPGDDDNAVVRVTQESGLHERGTVGARGMQGVTKNKDVRGATTGEKMGDKLGMEQSYIDSVKNGKDGKGSQYDHTDRNGNTTKQDDHFVAAIYTPSAKPKDATLKAMTDLIHQHGNADGLFGKTKGQITANVTKAMNTPAARKSDGSIDEDLVKSRPDIYGSMEIQKRKQELERRLGANQQKTSDGKTLTERGHNETESSYKEKLDAIKAAEESGKLSKKQATTQRNKLAMQYASKRKGDSVKEFYDDQSKPGTNPLEGKGKSAKKLEDYEGLPVVKRLAWEQEGGGTAKTTSTDPQKKTLIAQITEQLRQAGMDATKSIGDGLSDTAKGFRRENLGRNVASGQDLPANGYGHGGAGVGPVQGILNGSSSEMEKKAEPTGANKTLTELLRFGNKESKEPSGIAGTDAGKWASEKTNALTSQAAVDSEGNPLLDADGKPARVSNMDRAKSGMTLGLIGKDAAGKDNYGERNKAFVEKEKAELQARLADFDKNHISSTGDLTPAPTNQEAVLDTADNTWYAYAKEIQALKDQADLNTELKAEARTTKTKLGEEKSAVEANKDSVTKQTSELETKTRNQTAADAKINDQSGQGEKLSGTTGKVIGTIANFVVKFAEMCGMIPSRLTSAGQNASGRAKKIEDGVKGANDSGTTTKDKSEKDKQTVTEMKEVTKTATSDTTTATESLHAVSKSVDTAIVDTDVGSGELVSADAQISEKISTLEAKQGEERARHGTAVSTMSGWASDHEAKRTGQKAAAEKELEEIEKKKAELAQKAEDGGGEGGTGGTLNPEMAGAMPASAPKRLDPSLLEGGTPMPSSVQSRMEKAFGQSFSGVEIHTGADGNQAAAGFNSKAFTFGSQVFFGAGQFNPGTEEGDHLIAHELAHVNQQRSRGSSAVAKKDLKVTRPGSPDELAADRQADEVVSQLHPQPTPQEGATTESSGPTPAVPQVAAPGGPTAGLAEGGGAPAAPTSAAPELGQAGGNAPATRSGGTSSPGGGPSGGAFVLDQSSTVGQAPTCAGVGRTPDGIVDYYMETHWDPKEFHGIAKGVGYPGDLSTERVSTVDRLMPADTSPETRAVINVACSVASGFLDDYLINQAGEYLGIGGDFLKNLLDVGEGISNYVELEDPVGLAMFGGMTVLDGVIGGLDSFLDDMTTQLGYLGALAKGLGGAVVVLSAVPVAIGTAVANAVGFATVGALVAAIDGIIVGLNAAIEMVRMPLKAAQSLVDMFQSGLDVVQFMYNEYAAGQAEQSGRFDKAAKYRDLMRGNTFDAITDWLNGAANALLMIPLATELKLVGTIAINLVTSGPSLDIATWQGPTIDGTVGGMEIIADAISDTTVANDFLSEVGALQSEVPVVGGIGPNPGGLADPMRVDPEGMGRHYVERRAWQGPGALSAARQRTMDWLTTDYESVRADDPKWYQALINDIARPDDGANYKEATSPSYWIGQLLQGMPQLAEFVTDTSLEGIAVGCEAAAAGLPAAQPVFDSIALMVVEMKPQLQLVLEQVNAYVQEHDLDLSRLEAFTADLEGGLADLRGMLDPADELEAVAGAMIGTLEGMRVDPSRFDLPSWAPVDLVESAIAPLNSAIDAAIERIHSMQASIVEMWQTHVEGIILAVEGQVATFRAQISEGGAFRTELQAQVDAFKASVASATEALAAWDGVLTLDARAGADYLTSVAAAARAAAAEESAAESEGDPWQQILCDTAQPAVDAWRARHGTEVETQYRPPVPQWEIDACGELYEEAMADPAISSSDRAEIEAAYQACIALTGREGREALYQLWAAEEALVAAIRAAG